MATITADLTSGAVVELRTDRHVWTADEPIEYDGTDTGPNTPPSTTTDGNWTAKRGQAGFDGVCGPTGLDDLVDVPSRLANGLAVAGHPVC